MAAPSAGRTDRQWAALIGPDLAAASARARAAAAATERRERDVRDGGVETAYVSLLIAFLGVYGLGTASLWTLDGEALGLLLLWDGVAALAVAVAFQVIEPWRARSRRALFAESGGVIAWGLLAATLATAGLPVLVRAGSWVAGGGVDAVIGVIALGLAVVVEALLVVRTRASDARRPAGPWADARAFRDLRELRESDREGRITEASLRRQIERVRSRWARAPHPAPPPAAGVDQASTWESVRPSGLAPLDAAAGPRLEAARAAAVAYLDDLGTSSSDLDAQELVDGIGAAAQVASRADPDRAREDVSSPGRRAAASRVLAAILIIVPAAALVLLAVRDAMAVRPEWVALVAAAAVFAAWGVALALQLGPARASTREEDRDAQTLGWLLAAVLSGTCAVLTLLGALAARTPSVGDLLALAALVVLTVTGAAIAARLARGARGIALADGDAEAVAAGWLAGLRVAWERRLIALDPLQDAFAQLEARFPAPRDAELPPTVRR